MTTCRHQHLTLIPDSGARLRCRHCHLTIKAVELEDGYCPECFETSGRRRTDFEPVAGETSTRYRCEDCGALIDYRGPED